MKWIIKIGAALGVVGVVRAQQPEWNVMGGTAPTGEWVRNDSTTDWRISVALYDVVRKPWGQSPYARFLQYWDAYHQPVWMIMSYHRPRIGIGLRRGRLLLEGRRIPLRLKWINGVRVQGNRIGRYYNEARAERKGFNTPPSTYWKYELDITVGVEQAVLLQVGKGWGAQVELGFLGYIYNHFSRSIPLLAEPIVRVGIWWRFQEYAFNEKS